MDRNHNRLRYLPTVLALSLVGFSASCSSGNGTSGAGSPSGAPIKIGVMGAFQAPNIQVYPEVESVASAFAKKVNNTGGLRGRPVDVITCNDQFDPNLAAACARQLVADNVVAVIPGAEGYGDNLIPILAAAGIPYVGGEPSEQADYTSSDAFPIAGGTYDDNVALAIYMASIGCKKVGGVTITGVPASDLVLQVFAKGLPQGAKYVTTAGIAFNAPDVSAAVASLRSAGAQCAVFALDDADAQKVVTALDQSGQQFRVGAEWPQLTLYLESPSTAPNGLFAAQTNELYGVNHSPALTTYGNFMKQYAPSVNPALVWSENTYVGMNVLTSAIKQIPAGQAVTAPDLLKVLRHTTNADTGGIAPSVNFTQQFPVSGYNRMFARTARIYGTENGRIVFLKSITITP